MTRAARPVRGRWVLAALALLPVVELAVAIALAGWIGAGWTVLALLLISAAGLLVLRRAGAQAWRRFTRSAQGEPVRVGDPAGAGLDLLAGLLLALPGFVTGLAGALLLLPPTRRPAARVLGRGLRNRVVRLGPQGPVITGEVVDEPPRRPPGEPGQLGSPPS